MRQAGEYMKMACIVDAFGRHPAAWLDPGSDLGGAVSLPHFARLARTLEAAKFDFFFLADNPATATGPLAALSRWPTNMIRLEPLTLLSALIGVTECLGLAATASTSFMEPYNVARLFASLDHLSGGRAAWNVVTSDNLSAGLNFGLEGLDPHAVRYEKAREFVEVVRGLWDTWEDGAVVSDRETGLYFRPDALHELNHKGKYFSVKGPLNVARPPQGHPVIAQAGGSEAGRELAAETAEVVFAISDTLTTAQAYYRDVKSRMEKYGRAPEQLKIIAGATPVIGRTRAEAQEKAAALSARIHPDIGRAMIGHVLGGVDLSSVGFDSPIPDALIPLSSNGSKAYFDVMERMARQERRTLRELTIQFSEARVGSVLMGTPIDIADSLEEWFNGEAADGFMIRCMTFPRSLDDFTTLVVPELQRRGLMRTAYSGKTLRENLGLPRPAGRRAPGEAAAPR